MAAVGGFGGDFALRREVPVEAVPAVVQPDGNLQVDLDQIPQQEEPVHVYSIFYDNSQNPQGEVKDCTITPEQRTTIQTARVAMQRLIAPGSSNFSINLTEMRITYLQADGSQGKQELQELIDRNQQVKAAYDELINAVQPLFTESLRTTHYEAGCRTSSKVSDHHQQPLVRSTLVDQGLPSTYSDSAKVAMKLFSDSRVPAPVVAGQLPQPPQPPTADQQDAALKRIVAAEILMKTEANELGNLRSRRDAVLANSHEQRALDIQIAELQSRQSDRFAVYVTAAFYPSELSVEQITQAAASVKTALEAYIEEQRTTHNRANQSRRRGRFSPLRIKDRIQGISHPPEIDKDTTYCAAVTALMFSMLPAAEGREAYLKFCRQHELKPTAVCVADDLVQCVGRICFPPPVGGADAVADPRSKYLLQQARSLVSMYAAQPGRTDAESDAFKVQCLRFMDPAAAQDVGIVARNAVVGLIDGVLDPNVKTACTTALRMLDRNLGALGDANTFWAAPTPAILPAVVPPLAAGAPPIPPRRSDTELDAQIAAYRVHGL